MSVEPRSILCADTNPYFLHFVAEFLSGNGYEVDAASNVTDVLSLLHNKAARYGLIILADWFPGVEISELLSAVRATAFTGRIVVSSGELSAAQKRQFEELGASSFLLKPAGYSDLLSLVTQPGQQLPN